MAAPEPSKSLKPRSFGRGFLFRRLVFDSQGALAEIPAKPTLIVAPACRDFRASSSVLTDAPASQMPTLPNLMPELDQLLSALFLSKSAPCDPAPRHLHWVPIGPSWHGGASECYVR